MGVGEKHRLTCATLHQRANETNYETHEQRWPDLFDALRAVAPARPHGIDLQRLQYWLRGRKDRIVSGLKVTGRKNANSQVEWWIEHSDRTEESGCYTLTGSRRVPF